MQRVQFEVHATTLEISMRSIAWCRAGSQPGALCRAKDTSRLRNSPGSKSGRPSTSASVARHGSPPAGVVAGAKGVEHPIEKPRRKKAVVVAFGAADLSQVVARPQEFVAFIDDNPRAIAVEAEAPLYGQGDFNR
jgi:hypothetical protein